MTIELLACSAAGGTNSLLETLSPSTESLKDIFKNYRIFNFDTLIYLETIHISILFILRPPPGMMNKFIISTALFLYINEHLLIF